LGPVIAWRRATPRRLARQLRVPVAVGVATVVAVAALSGTDHLAALAMFGCGAFALTVALRELRLAGRRAIVRYRRYIVHAGMAILFLGVAASSSFQHATEVRVRPGQTFKAGGYDVKYVRA